MKLIDTLEQKVAQLKSTSETIEGIKLAERRAAALRILQTISVARLAAELKKNNTGGRYSKQYLYSVASCVPNHPMSDKLANRILELYS